MIAGTEPTTQKQFREKENTPAEVISPISFTANNKSSR